MSQTSFLESVVSWDERQCQQNVRETLPKLFSYLQEAAQVQEEIGILKIICLSFLPCVDIDKAEDLVFSQVTSKSCCVFDRVLQDIEDLPKQSVMHADLQGLVEIVAELLECYTVCIRYAVRSGSNVDLGHIHSIPYGAIHLLKGTYTHCKDSGEIYKDVLACIAEPLSQLFKKAHALQVAFLGMLEVMMLSNTSQQTVEDLCYICQGLFDILRVVANLDIKLVISLWKVITRLSAEHKHLVKDAVNVDAMVTYLCGEMEKGYVYLLKLSQPLQDSDEMSLSLGDEAAFQKSLKVLNYQLRVVISFLDSFIDSLSDGLASVIKIIVSILRSLPPSLKSVNISNSHMEDIRRQLVNGIDRLVNLLLSNRSVTKHLTVAVNDISSEDRLAVFQLLIKIIDYIPKHTDEVMKVFMGSSEDGQTQHVLDLLFSVVSQCSVEMSLFPRISIVQEGKPSTEMTLYEYTCIHLSALVGSLPAKYFGILEMTLVQNLFSTNMFVSLLARDVWCFLARFGTADLCFQHTSVLIEVWEQTENCFNLKALCKRLVKFLAPEHQKHLTRKYPVDTHVRLWIEILIHVLPVEMLQRSTDVLVQQAHSAIGTFIAKDERSFTDMFALLTSLDNLCCVFKSDKTSALAFNRFSCVTVEIVTKLWSVWDTEWRGERIYYYCFARLIELSSLIVSQLDTCDFLKILENLIIYIKESSLEMKWSALCFLQNCRKITFPPNKQQPLIMKKIANAFRQLLCDQNSIIHHRALEAFTKFSECTPHEDLVPECLGDDQNLQNIVVAYLSKRPHIHSNLLEIEYLEQQKTCLNGRLKNVSEEINHKDMVADVTSTEVLAVSASSSPVVCTEEDPYVHEILTQMQNNVTQLESICDKSTITDSDRDRLGLVHKRIQDILERQCQR